MECKHVWSVLTTPGGWCTVFRTSFAVLYTTVVTVTAHVQRTHQLFKQIRRIYPLRTLSYVFLNRQALSIGLMSSYTSAWSFMFRWQISEKIQYRQRFPSTSMPQRSGPHILTPLGYPLPDILAHSSTKAINQRQWQHLTPKSSTGISAHCKPKKHWLDQRFQQHLTPPERKPLSLSSDQPRS